jgi:hypothetical protein
MAEPQPSSRRSRQPRASEISAPHNSEEGEFSANQPANFVAPSSVRSIPVNPHLQMHSKFFIFFFYSSTNPEYFLAASLRERDERAARKAAKKLQKARKTEAAKVPQVEAAAIHPQVAPPNTTTQNSQFYSQMASSAAPLFSMPDFTNTSHSSPTMPVFQGSDLTLPPRNVGGWNQNQYMGVQSSNELEPWNQPGQHHGNNNFRGTTNFQPTNFLVNFILHRSESSAL